MRICTRIAVWGVAMMFIALGAGAAEYSELWGRAGEKWTPQSRLPDFSFAGYHCGEAPLPAVPTGISVKDFGAKGDGVADDSAAFLAALEKASGAVEVPPGRYKITQILWIKRSGVVLRGAGTDKTVLVFPTPLNEILPNWGATTSGQRTSNYSWSGGFVWLRGEIDQQRLAQVTAPAKRGDTALKVSETKDLKPGRRIAIQQRDGSDRSLTQELYSGDCGDIKNLRRVRAVLVCRVTKIEGETVHFDRPLRCDVRTDWEPEILSFNPSVSESGVEHLAFEFPGATYQGHFTELGFNAVAMSGVADCWARDIRIVNPDSGLFLDGWFCTAQGVTYESARGRERQRQATGHHGIYLGGGDNLFSDFTIHTKFMHDLTVARCAGNVCAHGQGEDICFDHHKYAPYENLFSDIDLGLGARPWQCGGGAALGKNCGARGTFWNIRSIKPLAWPPASFGPWSMNLVGLNTKEPTTREAQGKWLEAIAPAALEPRNLYEAQRARRIKP